jgi:D-beta-D-heptose 7-phosphate kinase/D-beta-D-heptose 1-phosphate adenosyltransferase
MAGLCPPSNWCDKTVLVSGGFDPIHGGHVQMIRDAAAFGNVIVVANSDDWLMRKKGYIFMSFEERAKILKEIKGVIMVSAVDDSDGTVCKALRMLRPDYFANGGDRGKTNTPEQDVCEELGIEMIWGVGGDYKFNSSSDLAKNLIKNYPK